MILQFLKNNPSSNYTVLLIRTKRLKH